MPEDINKILETKPEITGKNMRPQKPPLAFGRIMWQILAGVLAGALGAFVGYFKSYRVCMWIKPESGETGIGIIVLCIYFGYALTSPIGVYLAGRIGNQTGSFWATWAPCNLLAGLWIAAGYGCEALDIRILELILQNIMWFVLLAPLIFPVIGFNLTRRYKSAPPS
jgi:hypothetical protein